MKIDWKKAARDLKEMEAGWIEGYEYRTPIRVDASMLNFSVETYLAIHAAEGKDTAVPPQLFLGDGVDLQNSRITEADGVTPLKCETFRESKTHLWIKFTVPPKFVGVLFYIFYNKEKANG